MSKKPTKAKLLRVFHRAREFRWELLRQAARAEKRQKSKRGDLVITWEGDLQKTYRKLVKAMEDAVR